MQYFCVTNSSVLTHINPTVREFCQLPLCLLNQLQQITPSLPGPRAIPLSRRGPAAGSGAARGRGRPAAGWRLPDRRRPVLPPHPHPPVRAARARCGLRGRGAGCAGAGRAALQFPARAGRQQRRAGAGAESCQSAVIIYYSFLL